MNPSSHSPSPSPRNPWPIGIAAFLVLFALAVFGFAIWSTTQRLDMVSTDSYRQGLQHEGHMEDVRRTRALPEQPAWIPELNQHRLRLQIPEALCEAWGGGTLRLYRPSDKSLDRSLAVQPDPDGAFLIDTSLLRKGPWRFFLHWEMEGLKYYSEYNLIIR